jgi:hypothetical protein
VLIEGIWCTILPSPLLPLLHCPCYTALTILPLLHCPCYTALAIYCPCYTALAVYCPCYTALTILPLLYTAHATLPSCRSPTFTSQGAAFLPMQCWCCRWGYAFMQSPDTPLINTLTPHTHVLICTLIVLLSSYCTHHVTLIISHSSYQCHCLRHAGSGGQS